MIDQQRFDIMFRDQMNRELIKLMMHELNQTTEWTHRLYFVSILYPLPIFSLVSFQKCSKVPQILHHHRLYHLISVIKCASVF